MAIHASRPGDTQRCRMFQAAWQGAYVATVPLGRLAGAIDDARGCSISRSHSRTHNLESYEASRATSTGARTPTRTYLRAPAVLGAQLNLPPP